MAVFCFLPPPIVKIILRKGEMENGKLKRGKKRKIEVKREKERQRRKERDNTLKLRVPGQERKDSITENGLDKYKSKY